MIKYIDDKVIFIDKSNIIYNFIIGNMPGMGYFLDSSSTRIPNDILFDRAGIIDKFLFTSRILGYESPGGCWPFCHTKNDLFTVLRTLDQIIGLPTKTKTFIDLINYVKNRY